MELLVFGHAGARVIVFPTSMGRFFQWEDTGMIGALGEPLENGHIQVFCVDSVDGESWYNKQIHPADRARRHIQYDRYLLNEVLPFTTTHNANSYLMTTGTSFGAYHAVNFAFRYPQLVNRVVDVGPYIDQKVWVNMANVTQGPAGNQGAGLRKSLAAKGRKLPLLGNDDETANRQFTKTFALGRDHIRGQAHGLDYAEYFHHIPPDDSGVDEYVSKNSVPL